MSPFPLKGSPTRPPKHIHRLLQRHTNNESSTPALSSSSVPPFGTVSAPSSTPRSTLTSTTPPSIATVSAPIYTPASTPAFTPMSSTPPQFGTISALLSTHLSTPAPSSTIAPSSVPLSTPSPSTVAPSSVPLSTPAPSSISSSTPAPSTPSVNEQQQTRLDGRLRVQVRVKELLPSGKCSSIIRKSFLDKVDSDGYKWATLSEDTKQFYWEEFQKKCYWDAADAGSIKTNWEHKAKERYGQYIYNMRSETRNPTHEKPSHIEEPVWTAWNAIWSSEEFKKRSDQNKKNRRKGVEGGKAPPTHNGGSASHQQIANDMEEYLGEAPSCFDMFMFTHTKDHDGKTLIDEKSKQVHDYYVTRRADLKALGEEVDDVDLFYTAVGGHDRKRRVYGLGSYGRSVFLRKSSKQSTPSATNSEEHHHESKIHKLEETIEQQKTELNDMRNMMTDIRNTMNDMRSMIEK